MASPVAVIRSYSERLKASPVGYRLARGFLWSLFGTVLSRALSLLSTIFVGRMLGKVGMGELGIIQSTVGVFGAFAGLGMGLTATKYVAEYRIKDRKRAGSMLGLSAVVTWVSGIVITLAMFALAPWFAAHTLGAPHLTGLIRVGSVLLLLGAVNGAQTGALSGFEAFKSLARVNFAAGTASFPLMVVGVWRAGLTGAVWGLVASQAVNCGLSHVALRREAAAAGVPLGGRFEREEWAVLWQFSLPSMLCNVIFGPVNWACGALLVNRPGGYAQMGVYNAANNWFNAVAFLPGILSQVVLPLLSAHAGERKTSRKLIEVSVKVNLLAAAPVALVGSLVSPAIMGLYGAGFREGWPTMVTVMITAGLLTIQNPIAQWIIASARMWTVFFMYLGWGATCLGLSYALLDWGSLGLSIARLIAYVANGMWLFWFAFSVLKKHGEETAMAALPYKSTSDD